jgi:hypothetical protein
MRASAIAVVMRGSLLALVLTSRASAQPVPGTAGDPIRELMVEPSVVNAELPVLAVHGGNPEDTVILFDGFELPWLLHNNGVRSLAPPDSAEIELMPSAFGVEYGRGSSVVSLVPAYGDRVQFAELTPVELEVHQSMAGFTASASVGWNEPFREVRPVDSAAFGSAMGRAQLTIGSHWTLLLSGIYATDSETRDVARPIAAFHYRTPAWHAVLAASYLMQHELTLDRDAIDTRTEALRRADEAAGLTKLEWRIGQQTNSSHYDIGGRAFWRHDIGGWTSIAANLSAKIRATVGLRIDNFDGDVATQPRAALLGQPHPKLILALAAGAYRRPPEQPHEVEHDLDPERATHVAAGALFDSNHGLRINAVSYFIDRTRLVVREFEGGLTNTGTGTSLGIDLVANYRRGRWFGTLSTALTSSTRLDAPRGLEHPSDYEQPFRFDIIGGWQTKRVTLSARLQLASGLPFTPYTTAIYDSETDTYEPLYVPPLSARAPFHHQIDLRVDYRAVVRTRFAVDLFLDLHNAYRNRDAIAYRYSYDYTERTAISSLPLFPFAGVRASL